LPKLGISPEEARRLINQSESLFVDTAQVLRASNKTAEWH
jgi:hypothetical protein